MTAASLKLDLTKMRVRPLAGKTCLEKFTCGDWNIDGFAKKASKWAEQNRYRIFAGHEGNAAWGLGFYSLSVKVEDGTKMGTSQAQVYDFGAPLVFIDVLAVRTPYQGQGLGRWLLVDALRRAHLVSEHVSIYGVGLKSLNERTTAFYESLGFGIVDATEKHPLMVVPIWTLQDLFAEP